MRIITGSLTALILVATPLRAQAIPDSTMVVHHVDVGQGAAAVLEFSCAAIMIDAGGQAASDTKALLSYLDSFFKRRSDLNRTLEAVFVTHNHVDHTRALAEVASAFTVKEVIENGVRGGAGDNGDAAYTKLAAMPPKTRPKVHVVADADIQPGIGATSDEIDPVNCDGTDPAIHVMSAHPDKNPGWTATEFKNKNNGSLVIKITFGRASFLFTGDLEEPAIETLVAFHEDTPALDADVYQVGHHGSSNGTTSSLLDALTKPKMAILTSGPCDRNVGQFNAFQFGHPRADIVHMLGDAVVTNRTPSKGVWVADGVADFRRVTMKKAIYATGWDGTIDIEATKGGVYHVTTSRAAAPAACG